MGRYTGKTCRLSIMLTLTFTFFLVEIIFGYITNSMALVADSFHMLSDVVALIVAFFCMKISKKRSSSKNTFGWVRAEVLGALINAVFLIALCFSIFIEALKRIIEPESIHDPIKILIVGILGLVVNVIGIFMFHGHASVHGHSHARPVPLNLPLNGVNGVSLHASDETNTNLPSKSAQKKSNFNTNGRLLGDEGAVMIDGNDTRGDDDYDEDEATAEQLTPVVTEAHNIAIFNSPANKQEQLRSRHSLNKSSSPVDDVGAAAKKAEIKAAAQLNMHGVFLHILGDAFGSVIVIVNAIVYWQVSNVELKKYLDPSLSLVMALIIFSTTLPLFKESALILLQTVPTHINVEEIKKKLLKSIDGVLAVHEFHVWRLAGNKIIATAHIRCRNLDEYMKIAESVKHLFHEEGIHSTTIQPEFDEVTAPNMDQCVLECPRGRGREIECVPSMCCAVPATPTGIVTIDPAAPANFQSIDKKEGEEIEIRVQGTTTTSLTSPEEISTPSTAVVTGVSTTTSSTSSSEESQFKGVPPILYYNRETAGGSTHT